MSGSGSTLVLLVYLFLLLCSKVEFAGFIAVAGDSASRDIRTACVSLLRSAFIGSFNERRDGMGFTVC